MADGRSTIAGAYAPDVAVKGCVRPDVNQIHCYDPDTDIDETLGALTDLVRAGKVRYIGHSTFPVSAIVEAQWTARERVRERFRL